LVFKAITSNQGNTIFQVYYHVEDIQRAKEEEFVTVMRVTNVSFVLRPKWSAPDMEMVKINCDDYVRQLSGSSRVEGLACYHNGQFLWGFAGKIDRCSVVQAELWSMHSGQDRAIGKGLKFMALESDALTAVNLLTKECFPTHQIKVLFWLHLLKKWPRPWRFVTTR